jgi:hypothetical protein
MSTISLSQKAAKLMKLCDLEGYKRLGDLLKVSAADSVCPAICMIPVDSRLKPSWAAAQGQLRTIGILGGNV